MLHPMSDQPASPAEGGRKIRTMDVMVKKLVWETHDSVTITLFVGGERPAYKAGQFLSIKPQTFPELQQFTRYLEQQKGGREVIRAYSMASSPDEPDVSFTVKEEPFVPGEHAYPCLLSPLLVHGLAVGRTFQVSGFTGPYFIPEDIHQRTDHLLHVAAGSGIVPNFSMIKDQLRRKTPLRHTLLYGNKTYKDIIFRAQFEELQRDFPGKLRVVHMLSREPHAARFGPDYRTGRVTEEVLREFIPDPAVAQVFACGPAITKHQKNQCKKDGTTPAPRFMETVEETVKTLGVPKGNFHEESFG